MTYQTNEHFKGYHLDSMVSAKTAGELITEKTGKKAAKYMAYLRFQGGGPAYRKGQGKKAHTFYRVRDLVEWMNTQIVSS